MKTYLLDDRESLSRWYNKIFNMGEKFYPITIQVFKGKQKHRSLEQSAVCHIWYRQIAQQAEDRTPEQVECECKLYFGVPILRADSEDFRRMYDKVIKLHPDETKLKIMRFLPVTSLMNTKQMSEYLETIHYEYSSEGFDIEFPEEDRG
jgi:hypothetical protein